MKLLLFLLLLVSDVALGQNVRPLKTLSYHDSTDLAIATNYLITKLGQDFVKQHLVYKGHYQSVLHMVTFEITPQKFINNRNMIIVSMDGNEVETKYNTKITETDIKDYYKGLPPKNIFFNRNYALKQASRIKFPKGIKDWEIEIDGVADEVYWNIKSFDKESFTPMWSAQGKSLEVDIRTGRLKKDRWYGVE